MARGEQKVSKTKYFDNTWLIIEQLRRKPKQNKRQLLSVVGEEITKRHNDAINNILLNALCPPSEATVQCQNEHDN
jgi:hypothetical protein